MQLVAHLFQCERKAPRARRVRGRHHISLSDPGGAQAEGDRIRLHEAKVRVTNGKPARSLAYGHCHRVADGRRRFPLAQAIQRTVDQRVSALEIRNLCFREVTLALASVYGGDEDRRVSARLTPEAKRHAMPPALFLHDLAVKRCPMQLSIGTRQVPSSG